MQMAESMWQTLDQLPLLCDGWKTKVPVCPGTLAAGQPCDPALAPEVWAHVCWAELLDEALLSWSSTWKQMLGPLSLPFVLLSAWNLSVRPRGVEAAFPPWARKHQEKAKRVLETQAPNKSACRLSERPKLLLSSCSPGSPLAAGEHSPIWFIVGEWGRGENKPQQAIC